VAVEPKMERKEISTTAARFDFAIEFRQLLAYSRKSPFGSFRLRFGRWHGVIGSASRHATPSSLDGVHSAR
jgi:hypothetical protein